MTTKIQWHPAFAAAMALELIQNRDDLVYKKEYNLNTRPLEIDLLVIKKDASAHIANEIGYLFRGHNIVEYKSPEDHLDIDTFYKSMAYASLYKSYGNTVDEVRADDVTVSIIREAKPTGLFRYFGEHGFSVTNPYSGIYYINGNTMFRTQIVVTGELDETSHRWLKALSGRLKKENLRELLDSRNRLTEKADQELADSVLEVCIGANMQLVEALKGDDNMYEVLMEIMEPKLKLREEAIRKDARDEGLREGLNKGLREGRNEGLKEGLSKGRNEGRREGIHGTITALRDLGQSAADIKRTIMKIYGLSDEEAAEYL